MQPAITVIFNLIVMIAISSWMAFALARLHWYGRGVPLVVAAIFVAGLTWISPTLMWLVLRKSVPPTYAIGFGNWIVTGFAILLLSRRITQIPRAFADSARVDGCSAWGIYWRVVVPLVLRDLAVLALLIVMSTAPQFLAGQMPLPASVAALLPGSGANSIALIVFSTIASVVMTLPLLAIFFISHRDSQSPDFGRMRERL